MDTHKLLNDIIKPELNLLYTEPPHGTDGGWFCRYHAYHCFVLCRMLRKSAEIFTGHFVLNHPGGEASSLDTDAGHAWCSVEGNKPVDLSIVFSFWPKGWPQLNRAIIGSKMDGFEIVYTSSEDELRQKRKSDRERNWIGFLELETIKYSAPELVETPFLFLNPTGEKGWDKVYGTDIFNKVNLHLHQLATGKAQPLFRDYSKFGPMVQDFVMRQIKIRHPGATRKVRKLLE
jgi:hypothetical protein